MVQATHATPPAAVSKDECLDLGSKFLPAGTDPATVSDLDLLKAASAHIASCENFIPKAPQNIVPCNGFQIDFNQGGLSLVPPHMRGQYQSLLNTIDGRMYAIPYQASDGLISPDFSLDGQTEPELISKLKKLEREGPFELIGYRALSQENWENGVINVFFRERANPQVVSTMVMKIILDPSADPIGDPFGYIARMMLVLREALPHAVERANQIAKGK